MGIEIFESVDYKMRGNIGFMRGVTLYVFLVLFSFTTTIQAHALFEDLVPSVNSLSRNDRDLFYGFPFQDFIPLKESYDFIIVGAGVAGCVIARRLTEVTDWNILLIEAGGEMDVKMDIPYLATAIQLTDINWKFKTVPSDSACLGLNNSQCIVPRGKVLGGSSVLDYMAYTRGHKRDYDDWADMGNEGWSYADVLQYFLKSEDNQIPELAADDNSHNTGGPLTISYAPYRTPLADAFIEANEQLGFHQIDYNNAEDKIGASYIQFTMQNGSRLSAYRAFLEPVRPRGNFELRKNSHVTRVIFNENNKAEGVEFVYKNHTFIARATKEVILTAGAINSPQILMLSGIGPREHLEELGIPVIMDLSVGYNLMDSVAIGGVVFTVNDSVAYRGDDILRHPQNIIDYLAYRKGKLTIPLGGECMGYYDLPTFRDADGYPEIEIWFLTTSVVSDPSVKGRLGISDEIYDSVYKPIEKSFAWMPMVVSLNPCSRGRVMLRNADPRRMPLIYPNYFSCEEDLDAIVAGVNIAIELSNTEPFQRYGSKLHDIPIPACAHLGFASDDYWKCAVRQITYTLYSLCGTCKMGPPTDEDAVVDSRLKVYGIEGLRVCDASIIPKIIAGHTTAPTYMIAEKASDIIKEDYGITNW